MSAEEEADVSPVVAASAADSALFAVAPNDEALPAAAVHKALQVFEPPPRVAWAASAAELGMPLPDTALVAAYLRRLGFGDEESASMVAQQPLKAGNSNAKVLLCDLVQRHLLRIPFENFEQHGKSSPLQERQARLRDPRRIVEKLSTGWRGGCGFDLNPAFHWVLRQLGAKARLALSLEAGRDGSYPSQATHCTILVDLADGPMLVDPGFGDPPRTGIRLDGMTCDDLANYEVVSLDEAEVPMAGFTRALRRKRDDGVSLCRHLENPDERGLDSVESEWTALYAFRPDDDLASDSEEFQRGLEFFLRGDASSSQQPLLVCLALPRGHWILSERRLRRVEGGCVTEEQEVDSEERFKALASNVFAAPLLGRQLRMAKPLAMRKISTKAPNLVYGGNKVGPLDRSAASREEAAAKGMSYGNVSASSIAVGGAGAGGGMGLNAPGFGKPPQHFSGARAGTGARSIIVEDAVCEAWRQVQSDNDALAWVFCEYSANGKGLSLTAKGEGGLSEFKASLGDSIGWGGFRCYGVDKRGGVECKRPKFVFVQYKPEATSAIKKAKQGSHKGDVKDALCGAHMDVVVENMSDLDEQRLIERLQAATGAHKPNGYEFAEGVFLEADYYGLGIGQDCKGENSKN